MWPWWFWFWLWTMYIHQDVKDRIISVDGNVVRVRFRGGDDA